MSTIQMQYKMDTGNKAIVYAEEHISYDEFEDAQIYAPEYVEWLEEKVETLQKQKV